MRLGLRTLLAGALVLGVGCGVDTAPYPGDPGGGSYPGPVDQGPPPSATQGGAGGLALSWSLFSGGHPVTCSQAGVDTITINLQDSTGALVFGPNGTSAACDDFSGTMNVAVFDQVAPGSYQVLMTATGSAATYGETGAAVWVTVVDGSVADPSQPTVVPLDDQGPGGGASATGGLALSWNLYNGGYLESCAQAGVDTVTINLQDGAGNLLYGPSGVSQACADSSGTATVAVFDQLPAGSYQVLLTGTGAGGTYSENAPAWVTVTPGSVADPNLPTIVSLYQ